MRTSVSWYLVAALLLIGSPAVAGPSLQQIGHAGPTEVIIYTDSAKAVVRQQSVVRLSEGMNTVGFEWASDRVDAASVRLLGGEALQIGDVIEPAGTKHLLRWTVHAPDTTDYALTTSFLLSGLNWSTDYRLGWRPGEENALLGGWLTVKNESGVDLNNMQAALVLGRPGAGTEDQAVFLIQDLRELEPGSSIRAAFLPPMQVPARTIYRIDSETAPERVQRLLQITPPAEGPLAQTALPGGPLTVITPTEVPPAGMHGAKLSYEPSEPFTLTLGQERDIVVERRLMERRKIAMEFDRLGEVSGFDTVESYAVSVRNHLNEAIELEMVETVLETWELKTDALHILEDGEALMLLDVPADGEATLEFTLVKHSGTRIP